ncbi:unnamed protein product [Echinostoma caproni]|uniref:Galactokinase n=1 Tax=Echinostoma caproni TaxID=27848 RepID=A0A183AM08_9TREM|nr:unnamed protein product [Echinostoma caproni]
MCTNSPPPPSSSSDDKIPLYELSDVGRTLSNQLISMGHPCNFVVRAPGRVNLIGEHIDYNGYAVLPMALTQAVHIAVGLNKEPVLVLSSTEPDFESVTVPVSEAMKFGSDGPPKTVKWFHYFMCAYHGITDYVNEHKLNWNPPGLFVRVGGAQFGGLWPAAGLSSSSAFVVGSAIAVMQAAGVHIGRRELAGLCARCEQYIGMQGGGMDQATSLLGRRNSAIMIEFTKPLITVHPVPLPLDVVFVIAHSGVHARKAATSMYNERVSECRLATSVSAPLSPAECCARFLF